MRNALGHGATVSEIMEVLQLTSVLGIHTITEGVPALLDEARKAGKTCRLRVVCASAIVSALLRGTWADVCRT
jgi:hypothetical protein